MALIAPSLAEAALFEAARLSASGLGAILVYLAGKRLLNAWRWRIAGRRIGKWQVPCPRERFDPPRATGGNPTTFFAGVLGAIPLLAFVPAIAAKHIAWLGLGPSPLAALMAVWCLCVTIGFLLWKLSFRPVRKLAIATGWVVLAHAAVWLEYWAR